MGSRAVRTEVRPRAASRRSIIESGRAMNPLVTVAITTLNRPTFLKETLGCVLSQDYPNLDILISDNGSTDATPALARELAGSDSRVRFRRNEMTVPFTEHCSQCVEAARGDYFLLLHDDDRISPRFISQLIMVAGRYPDANVVVPTNTLIDQEGRLLKEFDGPGEEIHDGPSFLLHWLNGETPQYLANVTTVLFRTSMVRYFGCYRALPGTRNNDNLLFVQVGMTSRIGFARQAIFGWRIHPQNLGETESPCLIAASGLAFLRSLRADPRTKDALRALPRAQRKRIVRGVAWSTAKEVVRHLNGQRVSCQWPMVQALLAERRDPVFLFVILREYLRAAFPRAYSVLRHVTRPPWIASSANDR
jgi:hypothetical protein